MVNYTCVKCNKEFVKKSNYLTHMNKKNPCEPIIVTTNYPPGLPPKPPIIYNFDNINSNICIYCNTIFTRKDVLKRHIDNRCKVKKLKDEEEEKDKENIFKLLLAKDEEMKKRDEENKKNMNKLEENNKKLEENNKKMEEYVKKLSDMNIELNNKVGKLLEKMSINNINNNINNITNNTNITNINISKDKLVNFGEEDIKEIELKLFDNCFNKFGKHIFEASAKNIWFDKPKNKNFYISDLSRDKAMCYKDGQFYLTPITTVLTTINQQLYKYFKHNIEQIKKSGNKVLMLKVEKEIMQAYKMFFNAFDNDVDRYQPTAERLEEYSKVVNSHLTKFFNSVKTDIINNYEQIKKNVLDDNLLKQIEYEPPKKSRGRPKKISNTEEIKITTIPKSVSGKNEIKAMLKDLKNEIKDIKIINIDNNDSKTNNKKEIKSNKKETKSKTKSNSKEKEKNNKSAPLVINRKGKTYYINDSDSDLKTFSDYE